MELIEAQGKSVGFSGSHLGPVGLSVGHWGSAGLIGSVGFSRGYWGFVVLRCFQRIYLQKKHTLFF